MFKYCANGYHQKYHYKTKFDSIYISYQKSFCFSIHINTVTLSFVFVANNKFFICKMGYLW